MPYIKQIRREILKKSVDNLLDDMESCSAGDLNYVISTLVWSKWLQDPSYATGNMLIGMLECAKLEFYRRRLAPYENKALKKNGDL